MKTIYLIDKSTNDSKKNKILGDVIKHCPKAVIQGFKIEINNPNDEKKIVELFLKESIKFQKAA